MVIYGINPVQEALQSHSQKIEKILMAQGKSAPRLQQILLLARQQCLPIRFESSEVLKKTAGTDRHQGVVAIVGLAGYVSLEEILATSPSLLLLLDGVEDPQNLGAVLRTAEAAGVDGVLLPERRSCGLTAAVFKASAGAAAHLKITRVVNVARTLESLKEAGFWIVGLDASGTMRPDQIDPRLRLVLVAGSEHKGVRRLVRGKCDFLVALPMKGKVSSLNLSVAAGILIYHVILMRERTRPSGQPPDQGACP